MLWKVNLVKMSDLVQKNKILGMLGLASRARKIVTGTDLTVDKIRAGKQVSLVVIASDVSQNTLKKLVNCCEYYGVEYIITEFTKDEISRAVGKECYISSVAILEQNFSVAIKKLF